MSINKVTVYVFFVIMSASLSGMEKQLDKSQELNKSQSSDSVSPYTFSFSLPTISGAVNSIATTYNNYMYDTEAFKKLGWPESDPVAQQELKNNRIIYQRLNNYFATRIPYDRLLEDHKAVGRRYEYCRRVLEKLPQIPKRSEALALATFCLNTHGEVMNDFLKTDFLLFVSEETGKSMEEVQKATLELAQLKIVPDNNPLLNNLFEQTAREKQKKEEEDRKRKEQEDKEKKDKEEKERIEREEAEQKQKDQEEKERIEKERIEREEKEKKDKEERERIEKEEAEKKRKEQEEKERKRKEEENKKNQKKNDKK